MIPDFPETSEIELPFVIAETIASWRRIFVGRDGADPHSLLRHAAAELWETIEINRMVHPESHVIARQEGVDALQDMAEIGGIAPDDAQLIFAESFKRKTSSKHGRSNGQSCAGLISRRAGDITPEKVEWYGLAVLPRASTAAVPASLAQANRKYAVQSRQRLRKARSGPAAKAEHQ